ncbi:MAG: polysaccharide deacetylase family protein [Candidatus Pacearchaeota archaeon]
MIKKIQLLVIFTVILITFEFIKIIREGEIIQKTLSIGLSDNPVSCNVQSSCNFAFSSKASASLLEISKNKIMKNEKITGATSVKNDFCLKVPVLTYHRIQPWTMAIEKGQTVGTVDDKIFDQQMSYLAANGYNTIFAEDLVDALKSHAELSPKSVLVTLDDGYENAYTYAFPIAQKYQIKLNLMIPTGLVGNQDFLSWDQIKEMKDSGLVYFTAHTWSHSALGLSFVEKIQYEVKTSKSQLEQYTGQSVNIFTYPYGSFNDTVINILKENGFTAGFSTIFGNLQCESYIMTLHRTGIGNSPLSSYGL